MTTRKTKIVCTIGPATRSPAKIEELIHAGMNVARLNFSHGSYEDHGATVAMIRAASKKVGVPVAILQDLSGPKMRTGNLATDKVQLVAGQPFILTERDVPGDASAVTIACPGLVESVSRGSKLLLGDGELELRVEKVNDRDIHCIVVDGGMLGSRKGICAPGVFLRQTVPTDKDLRDLAFGLEQNVDWIAQSFVRTADEIRALRKVIRQTGATTPIIVKLEKREALDDLDGIIRAAAGVMVARGDLALEIGFREMPAVQKQILRRATELGKPDITATQMLESMITNPRPTRAEVTDIANAIFDGTDAVMLSGETAVGAYPIQACRMMAEIAETAEEHIDYVEQFRSSSRATNLTIEEAIGHGACDTALKINASLIICCTRTGRTANIVAGYRPPAPIAVVSPYETTLLRTMPLWGTRPVFSPHAENTDAMIEQAKHAVLAAGLAKKGDRVVVVAGAVVDKPGTTNTIKADIL